MAMTNIYIKPRSVIAVLVLILLLAGQSFAGAASLWADQGSLFGDRKAREIGDTLTIIINESSTASRTGKSNNAKSGSTSVSAGTGFLKFIDSAGASSSDSFTSAGAISNTNTVSGRITVQVSAVKPNGNLVVSGTQSIKQNGEEQKITITGEVRPDDVSPDNTVLSSYVANAQIRIDGKGPISEKQRQGILTQIFNFLF
ncbi:MAG TPA: flagellar basal body L-ring protein FlgH [Selenomonadales bacterium]|nr:flagellar basal body L-ring protein FlgH [Selenomonadales bacterium]